LPIFLRLTDAETWPIVGYFTDFSIASVQKVFRKNLRVSAF